MIARNTNRATGYWNASIWIRQCPSSELRFWRALKAVKKEDVVQAGQSRPILPE
jgi:hypothetical protein